MKRFLGLAAAAFLLSGCLVGVVDVSHAHTNKGFLNSGNRDIGRLIVYDTENDFLQYLDVIPLTDRAVGKLYDQQSARDIEGYSMDLATDVAPATRAAIDAEITAGAEIVLKKARRVSTQNTITHLANYIDAGNDENDYGKNWMLNQAVAKDSTLRYALIWEAFNADEAKISHRGNVEAGGEISVPTSFWGRARVKLAGLSEEQFSGDQVPVFVDYYVFKAFKNSSGNFDFEIDPTTSKSVLQKRLQKH